MATKLNSLSLELLISGYIRIEEKQLDLYMNFPSGLDKIMHALYPVLLFKFGDCNPNAFKLTKEGLVIKGADLNCWGHLVYANLGQYSDIGLSQGVHLWSIKSLRNNWTFAGCFASIGVTTEKNEQLINDWDHRGHDNHHWIRKDKGFQSHWQGCYTLDLPMTVTIKLDCVTYYRNKTEIKTEAIEPNKSYYLAMLCCTYASYTHLSVVESDIS